MAKNVKRCMALVMALAMVLAMGTAALGAHDSVAFPGYTCTSDTDARTCGSFVGSTSFQCTNSNYTSCIRGKALYTHTVMCSCGYGLPSVSVWCQESHTPQSLGGCGKSIKDCYRGV